MESKNLKLTKEQVREVCEYREVLNRIYKQKFSMKQALADWIDKGYNKTG